MTSRSKQGAPLNALGQQLKKRGLNYFIGPRVDQHQGEYSSLDTDRLAWMTGANNSYKKAQQAGR